MSTVKPDTWAAVDGLGRTLSDAKAVGEKRTGKFVGCFYWLWYEIWQHYEPRNITKIMEAHPEARNDFDHPAWGEGSGHGTPYYWNEPLLGYYQITDPYVIRKHAELLADAGVDVLFFDCSNDKFTFKNSYEVFFKELQAAKAEGVRVPQVAFLLNFDANENTRIQLTDLWETIYKPGWYQDLWFYWEGKPLIMAHSAGLNPEDAIEGAILNFFTFRRNEPTYFYRDTQFDEKTWGWCSSYPQAKYGVRADGSCEQMCVSVGQNANEHGLVAMNDYRGGVQGRAFSKGDYQYQYTYQGETVTVDSSREDAFLYGVNFQQQWDRALEADPDFIFVTGWNEHVCQRLREWQGSPNGFSDNFTDEYSRDIEPSSGVLKDHFYYQLVENIRRFKGVTAPALDPSVQQTIDFTCPNAWDRVTKSYDHYVGSTKRRNHDGAKGCHYESDTMRNDIVRSKVAYDDTFVYFMVETLADLTPATDAAWMRLLIQTDPNGVVPNWEGFNLIVNRVSPDAAGAVIERSLGGWHWEQVGIARMQVAGKCLQLAIPRTLLDPTFNFKWADNTQVDGDILDFYKHGDVAPGGRFMFRFEG